MEVILQHGEKLDSTTTTEKSINFWSKETLLKRYSQEPQEDRKSAASKQEAASPSFFFWPCNAPLMPPIDRD